MGSLFSGFKKDKDEKSKKKSNNSGKSAMKPEDKALLDCKVTRDNIKNYIKRLEKNSKLKKDKAKEALKDKNKDRARMYLRQSKMYSEQAKSGYNQLQMIEDQISQIESAQISKSALEVLKEGNEALKKLQSEVSIEKWEKVADDMEDIKAQQEEIGEFFQSKGLDAEEQEEEINKELDDLFKITSQESVDLPEANKEEVHVPEAKEEVKEEKKEAALA